MSSESSPLRSPKRPISPETINTRAMGKPSIKAMVLLCKGSGEGAQLAVMRRHDGVLENAMGGTVDEVIDIGEDDTTRALECVRRVLRKDFSGQWLHEVSVHLPFLGVLPGARAGAPGVVHVFARPVAAPAHRVALKSGQGGLTFVSVADARRIFAAEDDVTVPSFGDVLDLFASFAASGRMSAYSGVCVGCGDFGVGGTGCGSCGAPCDATCNAEHYAFGEYVGGFRA